MKNFKIIDTEMYGGRGETTTIATISYEEGKETIEERVYQQGNKYYIQNGLRQTDITKEYINALNRHLSRKELDMDKITELLTELNFVAKASNQYKIVDTHAKQILELLK